MVKIGIVGCGTIGTGIARAVESGRIPAVFSGLNNRTRAKADALARTLSPSPPVLDLPDLVRASTLVVEAATRESLAEIVPMCLREGKDVFVISVGGLLDHPEWFCEAEDRGCTILLPSGAIAGLDGVRGAAVGRIDSVTLTTRKPPRGLIGAPYLVEHNIDVNALTVETLVFEGTAREACRGFPSNVNVSAALSLAGVGPDKTRVRILAVPGGSVQPAPDRGERGVRVPSGGDRECAIGNQSPNRTPVDFFLHRDAGRVRPHAEERLR